MNNILVLLTIITINANAGTYKKPVNFQKDRRPGQVISESKTTFQGNVSSNTVKICFQSEKSREKNIDDMPGCEFELLLDTTTELKYAANCKHNGLSTYYWKKVSENVLESLIDSKEIKIESKLTYTGPNCDSDAVKM